MRYSAVCTKTLKGLGQLKISKNFKYFWFPHILWVYLTRKTCGQHQFTSLNILGHPKAVVRQSSGSHQAVIRQSSGSHQDVIGQSSSSCQAILEAIICHFLVLYILLPYLFRGIQETLLSYKTNVTDYITSDSNFWILVFNLNFFLKVRYKVAFSKTNPTQCGPQARGFTSLLPILSQSYCVKSCR